jgi:hypothetical protein
MAATGRTWRVAAIVGAVLVVGGLVALLATSGGSSSNHPPSRPSTTLTRTTLVFHHNLNARYDVTEGPCLSVNDHWSFSGSVHNSSRVLHRRYELVIDFISQPGDTVLDTKIVNIAHVNPHQTVRWRVIGAPGQPKVGCVLRFAQRWPIPA